MPDLAARFTIGDVLKTQGLSGDEDPAALCLAIARSRRENFPVLSLAVPARLRAGMAAVYAFCRLVDDLGDEAEGDRRGLLDAWEEDLLLVWNGEPRHPVLRALIPHVRSLDLPPDPFRRLVRANRMDQARSRWGTFDDLLDYCRHSAAPVGRMVLLLHGFRDEDRFRRSDAVCTALQLANFWQDVGRDLRDRGRIYLPQEDLDRFGVPEAALSAPSASPALRKLIAFEAGRTRRLFVEGLGLTDLLEGRLRWAVSAFCAGGLSVLDALAARQYDPLMGRPEPASKTRVLAGTLWRLSLGAKGPAVCPSSLRSDGAEAP